MLDTIDRHVPGYSPTPLDQEGPPEIVEMELMHTCNLRCTMCHVSFTPMTKVKIDPSFVDRLSGLEGKWAKIGSEFEPTSHPQFAQIVNGVTDQGMRIDLTTNGTLFTDRLIRQIDQCNFQNVTVSFDGATAATFEKIRRRASFALTVRRIAAFKDAVKARNPSAQFCVNYTFMQSNIDEVADAVDLWESHGFDHIGFISMRVPWGAEEALAAESPSLDLPRARDRMLEAARRIVDGNYRITATSPWFRDPAITAALPRNAGLFNPGMVASDNPLRRTPYNPITHFQDGSFPGVPVPCRSPYKLARINYDGRVLLCQKYSIGSIYDADLLALWEGEKASAFRCSVKRDIRICHTCDYFKFCINANNIDYRDPTVFARQHDDPLDYDPTTRSALVATVREFNIVRLDDIHLVLPRSLGPTVVDEATRTLPGVTAWPTLTAARRACLRQSVRLFLPRIARRARKVFKLAARHG
jgi:radical SAM protein with 4Fe4S-binding SPASM domain